MKQIAALAATIFAAALSVAQGGLQLIWLGTDVEAYEVAQAARESTDSGEAIAELPGERFEIGGRIAIVDPSYIDFAAIGDRAIVLQALTEAISPDGTFLLSDLPDEARKTIESLAAAFGQPELLDLLRSDAPVTAALELGQTALLDLDGLRVTLPAEKPSARGETIFNQVPKAIDGPPINPASTSVPDWSVFQSPNISCLAAFFGSWDSSHDQRMALAHAITAVEEMANAKSAAGELAHAQLLSKLSGAIEAKRLLGESIGLSYRELPLKLQAILAEQIARRAKSRGYDTRDEAMSALNGSRLIGSAQWLSIRIGVVDAEGRKSHFGFPID